jgi:diketogulonate reductase-like aldo/keto reductase
MTERQTLRLNNGVTMPALGFGVLLTSEQVAAIGALDTGVRGGPDPDSITPEAYGREIPEA